MEASKLDALIAKFEPRRQKRHHAYVTFLIAASTLLVLALIFLFLSFGGAFYDSTSRLSSNDLVTYLGFGSLVGSVILYVIGFRQKRIFSSRVRDALSSEINASLFPQAVIDPSRGLLLKNILYPGFFPKPSRYLGSDYMTATYHGISFEKGHYRLQRQETDGQGRSNYVDYADGTMYRFAFGRDFRAVVKVIERAGALSINMGQLKKVETEFIAFNKKFLILTSDETAVFFILTPQIQEKIMSLERLFKGQFYMAFIGNELYIAANSSDGSFEAPWSQPLTRENVEPLAELLAIPAVFIDLLGLDTAKYEKNGGVTV